MATFPGGISSSAANSVSEAALKATAKNAVSLDHATLHREHADEITATQTKLGTGASTPASGKVLGGTGPGSSSWTDTISVASVTASGALAGASASITGTMAAAAGSFTTSWLLNSDLAYVKNADNNIEIRTGGVAGTIRGVIVTANGSITAAITTANGTAPIYLMSGTYTPSAEISITIANTRIVGMGQRMTSINGSSFAAANQSILKISADNVCIQGIQIDCTSANVDNGIETVTTSANVNGLMVFDCLISNLSAGKTGVYTDATNSNLSFKIQEVYISGTAGTGIDFNRCSRSRIDAYIDVSAGTHWDFDANSNYNAYAFIVNVAGTDTAATSAGTQVVF